MVLVSKYFDDATLQDLSTARGRAQRQMRGLYRMMGIPLAVKKQVDLTFEADFLGLMHDFTRIAEEGLVGFKPRKALLEKAKQMLMERVQTGRTTPAEASKLRGVMGFTFTAYYGQVG